jgi:hypothetical protein
MLMLRSCAWCIVAIGADGRKLSKLPLHHTANLDDTFSLLVHHFPAQDALQSSPDITISF